VSQQSSGAPQEGRRTIDFDGLRALNPEIIAWITVDGTDIDYPVVKGADNDFYLTHSATGQGNKAGAIFLDHGNASDFSDQNTIIYGHNMKDGSMFAGLHKYEQQAFLDSHPYVRIYTPDGKEAVYSIFAAYPTPEDADTYTIGFGGSGAFMDYIAAARGRSHVSSGVEVGGGDNMITLSTCIQGRDTQRYVLQAVNTTDGG